MIAIPNKEKPKSCDECVKTLDIECCGDIRNCPLIDIVQCKECKYSHMTYGGECKYCDLERDDDGNFIECYFDGDHFCGFGERRADERY